MAVIGIDLGTTNSLAAVWKNNKAELIKNRLGSELTPSVVSVHDAEILVGQHAKERLVSNPELTAAGFKRYMGTNKKFELGGYTFSPEELSSLVIKKLVEDAKIALGEEIEEAVISVPAYFNNEQRNATKLAARLAGVHCERIINEPSAAALFCRIGNPDTEQTVLVFDMGGGTLDVSVVDCFENIVEIQAIAGDNHLGGKDFDELIAKKFCEENGLDYEGLSDKNRQALLRRAELCKIELSEAESSELHFRYEEKEYQYTFTNQQLVETCGELFLRMKQIIQRALKDSGNMPEDITDILPVGGSCEMPVVREYLSHLFKRRVEKLIDGNKIVAAGLGVYCGIKMRNDDIKDILMTDVCPFSLGTQVKNPENTQFPIMSVIIERNTVLPASATRLYTTQSDQPYFQIYQGESYYVNENVKIGGFGFEEGIEDITAALNGGKMEIALTFSYDINGILDVTAKVLATGQEKHVSIVSENNPLTPEEIEKRRSNMGKIGFADNEENKAVLALASRIYEESVGTVREKAEEILYYFNSVLKTNSPIKIKKAREQCLPILEMLDAYVNRDMFEPEWEDND
ncbi:MAG: Hsp70 family protein [Bacteroides sp.]